MGYPECCSCEQPVRLRHSMQRYFFAAQFTTPGVVQLILIKSLEAAATVTWPDRSRHSLARFHARAGNSALITGSLPKRYVRQERRSQIFRAVYTNQFKRDHSTLEKAMPICLSSLRWRKPQRSLTQESRALSAASNPQPQQIRVQSNQRRRLEIAPTSKILNVGSRRTSPDPTEPRQVRP